jgi:hypothetical protein
VSEGHNLLPAEREELKDAANLACYSLLERLDKDPAALGFPPMLPIELALKTASVKDIFESYDLTRADAEALMSNAVFIDALKTARDLSLEHGWSFKMKALMQSEALLGTSWRLIHSADTPPVVKKDLILGTWRAAGVGAAGAEDSKPSFAIQINLG